MIIMHHEPARRHARSCERAWISCRESAAARAFGVLTGTSAVIAPVPSCIQLEPSPITSARWLALKPPRPRPMNTTID